ncbi:MAG: dephospho-CoA kinase [Eubacteriales bacterium]|nr:dephospho-CoA kinase [Eubacteriales bacterium]
MKANKQPYILGLTGGIASGKSNVARVLKSFGCDVIDADEISRNITADNGIALPLIEKHFGSEVMNPDGTLNRKELANIVFSDGEKLELLNSITHPLICKIMRQTMEDLKNSPVICLEVPLLFETGWDKYCDETWVVYTSYENQLARLMKRNYLTFRDAKLRIDAQMSTEERLFRSDESIDTSFSYKYTRHRVEKLWNDLLRRINIDTV